MKGLLFSITLGAHRSLQGRLERARVIGLDQVPTVAPLTWDNDVATLHRPQGESGRVEIAWQVDGFGDVIVQSASLMVRDRPYRLLVELARGEINNVRNRIGHQKQGAGPAIAMLRHATSLLHQAIRADSLKESELLAQQSLAAALAAGEELVHRHNEIVLASQAEQTQGPLVQFGCNLTHSTKMFNPSRFKSVFTRASLAIDWQELEAAHGAFQWDSLDEIVESCHDEGISLTAGPVINFDDASLPDWLRAWRGDLAAVNTLMANLVESCVSRYSNRVTDWEVAGRANSSDALSLSEEQRLWLTVQMIEVVRNIDADARVGVLIDRPWGDYLTAEAVYSPFMFADTIVRMANPIAFIELEVTMGCTTESSYCRSLLSFANMLEHFSEIGVPLRVRLGFPSATTGPQQNGQWRGPPVEQLQARWAHEFIATAVSEPAVEVVTWATFRDEPGSDSPKCGLIADDDAPKPAWIAVKKFCDSYHRGPESTPQ